MKGSRVPTQHLLSQQVSPSSAQNLVLQKGDQGQRIQLMQNCLPFRPFWLKFTFFLFKAQIYKGNLCK